MEKKDMYTKIVRLIREAKSEEEAISLLEEYLNPKKIETKEARRYFFDISDLVGNLFYIFKKNNINENKVSYNLIDKYTYILEDKFLENNIKAIFLLSRDDTEKFLSENIDIYREEINETKGVVLTKDITKEELFSKSFSCLPLDITKVLLDEEVVAKVISAYEEEKGKILKKTN